MAVKPGCFAIRRDQNLSPNQQLSEGATVLLQKRPCIATMNKTMVLRVFKLVFQLYFNSNILFSNLEKSLSSDSSSNNSQPIDHNICADKT